MGTKFDYGSKYFETSTFLKSYLNTVWSLRTPKNITYFWGFGRFLGIIIIIQIISGIILALYYVRGKQSWDSVVEITREVRRGWLIRLIHRNSASFVFLVLFIHFFRGIFQSSFYLTLPWLSGWVIKLLIMISAFLGYVLPWGQISFWGATVIINLIRVLPKGKLLVVWLWGGFYVSSFTCRFFFAFHFLVPLLVIIVVMLHLIFLHFSGSSLPGGLSRFSGTIVKFTHIFLYKDIVNLIILWFFILWMLYLPDWSADPVNFVPSDLSNSPLHIQPEWYFLHLYAILRSIPNKLGGLIGFFLAIFLLTFLSFVFNHNTLRQFFFFNYLRWLFFSSNLILLWLGIQPVEDPYIFIGQTFTVIYFSYFLVILLDWVLLRAF